MLERYGRDAPKPRSEPCDKVAQSLNTCVTADGPKADGLKHDTSPQSDHFHTEQLNATRLAWPTAAKIAVILGVFILIACAASAPRSTLTGLTYGFTAIILIHSTLRWAACFTAKPTNSYAAKTIRSHYPPYTVLVPLYHEAHMVPSLMTALSKLDYPQDALQVLLITEENDPDTGDAVEAFLRPPFEHVIVPRTGEDCGPQTKPNALNYAMRTARGLYVTIYDAEDHPDPTQLKAALHGFDGNPDWGALQAPLDYFNSGETWLTQQFALEYGALFHVWVPFLSRLGLPFPLGGTSNHLRGLM